MNGNGIWISLDCFCAFFWKNMYNRSECRWITHERCSRAHTSYSNAWKRNENWPLHSINNHFHLKRKREIIQKMDKVKYLDWSTQNVDRNETYTYSCLYHWIEWEPLLNQTLIRDRDVVEFWLRISIDDYIHWDEEDILIRSNEYQIHEKEIGQRICSNEISSWLSNGWYCLFNKVSRRERRCVNKIGYLANTSSSSERWSE